MFLKWIVRRVMLQFVEVRKPSGSSNSQRRLWIYNHCVLMHYARVWDVRTDALKSRKLHIAHEIVVQNHHFSLHISHAIIFSISWYKNWTEPSLKLGSAFPKMVWLSAASLHTVVCLFLKLSPVRYRTCFLCVGAQQRLFSCYFWPSPLCWVKCGLSLASSNCPVLRRWEENINLCNSSSN